MPPEIPHEAASGVIATRSMLDFEHEVWAVPAALLALVIDQGP